MITLLFLSVSCGGMRPSEVRRQRALAEQRRNTANTPKTPKSRRSPKRKTNKKLPTLLVRRKQHSPHTRKPENKTIKKRCRELLPLAKRVAKEVSVDLSLIMAVARVESSYNPNSRNRRSGATGLMQVMPSTGKGFKCGSLRNTESNLRCGARILKRYLKYFDGELLYGVAAYHSGPVAPKKARARGKLPRNMNYVEKVLKLRTRFRRQGCG
jgi:soluble lytic murein transglycosylase-like protein